MNLFSRLIEIKISVVESSVVGTGRSGTEFSSKTSGEQEPRRHRGSSAGNWEFAGRGKFNSMHEVRVPDRRAIRDEQRVIDVYSEHGLLRSRVAAKSAFDTSFNSAIRRGRGTS